MMAEPSVTVDGLTRRFRRGPETITALDEVSLDLYPGQVTVAAGPSGSGKTTLLSILAGFESLDAGAIRLRGGRRGDKPPPRPPVGRGFVKKGFFWQH
jgi:ABC-type Fe3+/spermidine/putrescine transport system ATPase subunit